jgi:ABC-2 type transport system ATP-binding protein
MVSNVNDDMLNALEDLDVVNEVNSIGRGRINISLKRSETSVNSVITAILTNGGNIASIKTNDPTLEDVFVAITARSRKEIKDGN